MPELTPEQKAQLDKNIRNMLSQGANESDVLSYSKDYRLKYDVDLKKKESSGLGSSIGGMVGSGAGLSEENKQGIVDYVNRQKPTQKEQASKLNGYQAKQLLSVWDKLPEAKPQKVSAITQSGKVEGTLGHTDKALKGQTEKRVEEYNTITKPLEKINPSDPNQIPKNQIYSEAVKWFASKDKRFARDLKITGVDVDDIHSLQNNIPNSKLGSIVEAYIQQPDIVAHVVHERPELLESFQWVSDNLMEDNPRYAKATMANAISQQMQKDGYNRIDPIFNFKKGAKEYGEIIGNSLFSRDPATAKIYETYKDEILDMIDAPSFFEGFASAGKDTWHGIMNTFQRPFISANETIKENWDKEAMNVTANPTGLVKTMRDIGHGTGFVASLGVPGGLLQGAGLAPKAASAISASTVFFGDELERAQLKYPDDPVKAWATAGVGTALFAALAYDIFPADKAKQLFQSVQPEVSKIVEQLSSGAITREVARQQATNLFKKVVDVGKESLKINTKAAAEMAGIAAVQKNLDRVLMDGETFDEFHTADEEFETGKHLFLSNSLVATMSGLGKVKQRNKMGEAALYEAASNPFRYGREIEQLGVKNPELNERELLNNLKLATQKKAELESLDYSPEEVMKMLPQEMAKDIELLEKVKSQSRIGRFEKDEGLDYFIEKAAEAPLQAKERFGESFEELINRVPNEVLEAKYNDLAKIDPLGPEALEIDRILTERGVEAAKPKEETVAIDQNRELDLGDKEEVLGEKQVEEKDISVGEMIGKPGIYNGEKGQFSQDGQTVIFKVDGKDKEYEIGNIDSVKDSSISELGIKHEESVVGIGEDGSFNIRGEKYTNPFEDRGQNPLDAIAYDKDGNIVNVRMKTPDGERRTFKGGIAEDLAYQIHLKEINKNNEARTEFEQFINTDGEATKEMENGGLPATPKASPVENNVELPKEKETVVNEQATNKEGATEDVKPIPPETKGDTKGASTETGEGAIPPKEPPTENKSSDSESGRDKGVLNHLYNAKNVPAEAKAGFEREGLKYKPQSKKEAREVAKSIVEFAGVEDSVSMAEANKLKGGVRSAVFAESLDTLYRQERDAKTPEEATVLAKKFEDIAIRYDEFLREGGRDISQVDDFYRKSPLGVVMKENTKRAEEFETWSKPKDKSWKEFYEELIKEPEFEKVFKEQVKESLKQERAEARKARIKKVDEFFDKAKDQFKGGAAYSTIIPPPIITAALEGMKKAYHAGEAVVELVQKAIDFISDQVGDTWDKEKFRKEWEDRLKESTGGKRKALTDEELKAKVLDKFRKKLKGLSDKEKDEVIRRSYKQIIENGGLDFQEFRKIIGEATGRRELTKEEADNLKQLITITNEVEKAGMKSREERTPESFAKFREAEEKAGKAAKELQDTFNRKPDIVKRLTSFAQLSTLGIKALVNNPIYNIVNQATLRFPIGALNTAIDYAFKSKKEIEYDVINGQVEFWNKLGLGTKEAFKQIFTGLNRMDYIQKELQDQRIRPFKAWRDLIANFKGKKKLSRAEWWDKALQGTAGVPAEAVARVLNLGDKPQRFAADGTQGAAFAKALGLKGMDYRLFIEFPREEAYRAYKAEGYSDAEAGQKADYVKEAIIKEGQRSTFQQDNLLNDLLTRGFGVFGGKDSGTANLIKTVTISPYIKIPSNAFWSFYNLLNPEVALLQSGIHGVRSRAYGAKVEVVKQKLQGREARYWLAHAVVGMATRAVVLALIDNGIFTPNSTDDDSKKERDATSLYDRPGTFKVGDTRVNASYFGHWGMMFNAIANKEKDMTQEQRENQQEFLNTLFGGMEIEGLKEAQNGLFGNSSALLEAADSGDFDRYLTNMTNMFANILQPAAVAQFNRAGLDYVPSYRGDNLIKKIDQQFAQRSLLYRAITGTKIENKLDMWGRPIPKGGNRMSRMFGISKDPADQFGRPIYEDAVRTGDSGFLPPAVLPNLNDQKLNEDQYADLQNRIGAERIILVGPYINDMSEIEGYNVKYSQLSDEDRKKVLQYLYTEGRDRGVEKFYQDYPELKPKEKKKDYIKEAQEEVFRTLQKYKK